MYGKFGNTFPRAPGHEVAGEIIKVGEEVNAWTEGQHVAVGWFGGSCGMCTPCRRGRFVLCEKQLICGISYDGGYCHIINVPQTAVAKIPNGMPPQIAGPLACAGVTVFNAIRNMHIPHGRVVAIQGTYIYIYLYLLSLSLSILLPSCVLFSDHIIIK